MFSVHPSSLGQELFREKVKGCSDDWCMNEIKITRFFDHTLQRVKGFHNYSVPHIGNMIALVLHLTHSQEYNIWTRFTVSSIVIAC